MTAQSQKMNVIASNLANIDSVTYKNGKFHPYIAKKVIFEFDSLNNSEIGGVKISDIINDATPVKLIYDPNHPMANKKGYILASNVNPISETINNLAAARNYQANIEVFKAAKSMINKTLTIIE